MAKYTYQKFTIRLNRDELDELAKEINKLHVTLNRGRKPKLEKAITKSRIALKALEIGLKAINKKPTMLKSKEDS
jgi:hypothetical protein